MKKLNCFTLLMSPCLFCRRTGEGTLLLAQRRLAPCVAVPKRGTRHRWDRDSTKAESSGRFRPLCTPPRRDTAAAEEGRVSVS